KYTADIGLANDPDVLLFENFEAGTLPQSPKWDVVQNLGQMALISDSAPGSGGSRALQITSIGGQIWGGTLGKKFPGISQLYLRYYVRYVSGDFYHHSGGYLGGASDSLGCSPP